MNNASDPSGWIEKARQDARSARRLLADPAELEPAAYHVQQAVEKALKAALIAEGIKFPRGKGAGHNLAALAGLIPAHLPLHQQAQMLTDLTPWATAYRYPADDPFTAQSLPAKAEIEIRLAEVEIFIGAVAAQVARPA